MRRCVLWLCVFVTSSALAIGPGEPVFDFSNYHQMLAELKQLQQQYTQLRNLYRQAQREYQMTQGVRDSLQGQYGYGAMLDDVTARNWSPVSWDDALKGVAGGNTTRYETLKQRYVKAHPTLSKEAYQKGSSQRKADDYVQQASINQTATVQSTYTYDELKKHVDTLHQLTQKIDATDNAKAAMDLNSRIQAEMAYLQVESLKMQTLLNQQLAQQGASQLASETESAEFNTLPET